MEPNAVGYTALITLSAQKDESEDAERRREQAVMTGSQPNVVSHTMLIKLYSQKEIVIC